MSGDKSGKRVSDPPVQSNAGSSGRDVVVQFGSVPVSTVAEKWIEVTNVSPVS